MTEIEIRERVLAVAKSFLGCAEKDGTFKQIIDTYNAHNPLARQYPVKYNDEWCATTVSAVAIICGYTDIMPTECSCGEMVKLYQALGRWQERDDYVPQPADIIMYDWQDDGKGDCGGWPDHVGLVVSVDGATITTIEGNVSDSVAYRTTQVNARYIRGYGIPDYASLATPEDIGEPSEWARVSCAKAVNNKIFHGDGTGFNWKNGITREELCVVLDNLGLLG